ncbi:MAG: ABC transporter permease [Clostridiales bacterium]|nr:ABC transporter permease [Clostridiales bacterium]MCF8021913.1 ABC transporter permease [Clostridiales bacterium]
MNVEILIPILSTAITAGTPILYAALGEILTERSGILNLGVEGMMLVGAVSGFMITLITSKIWLGLIAAMLAGGSMALIHAFLTITMKANQTVTGLSLTIFGTGLSAFLGKSMVGTPLKTSMEVLSIPYLSKIPFVGPIFFEQDPLVYLSYILVPFLWFLIYKTNFGLQLRAIGENPAAADSLGINVFLQRYAYVIMGGILAGLGGAYLSMFYVPTWMENMVAGRGWIAIALVIFATWNPAHALWGAYIFGGIDALGFRLQAMDIMVQSYFLKMLPYIFTVIVLIIITRKNAEKHIGTPQALGIPYDREER